jgi:tetratricopeptide (TPR) repeat protein
MRKKRNKSVKRRQEKRKRISLSLCMIVKDEAENIRACIRSIKRAVDEILIVDTGSTDSTQEIAGALGAKVFQFPWCDDFAAARNESIRHATGDYIIWLDADDRVDPSELTKIRLLKQILPKKKSKAFFVVVNSQSPVDGESLFRQLRIFPNIPGAIFEGRVHEQIFHNLRKNGVELVETDIIIKHVGYRDAATIRMKGERNLHIIVDELRTAPDNPLLHYNAARTLAALGRRAEAVEHMKNVTQSQELKATQPHLFLEASVLLGRYYLEMGLAQEAASLFSDLSRQFARESLVRFYFGESLLGRGKHHQAIAELEKSLSLPLTVTPFAVNLDLVRFRQYYCLGIAYSQIGQIERAKKMFLKCLNLHSEHCESLRELGVLSLKDGHYKEAIEYFERAASAGATTDQNYTNLGLAYKRSNQLPEAEKAFLKALQMNPHRLEALTNLGHLYLRMNEYAKAADYFARAKKLDPHLIDVKLALSLVHFQRKETESMVAECDSLLEELGLPRDLTINGFEELAILFETIGDRLNEDGRSELGQMAYGISLKIFPLPEVMKKMATRAAGLGLLESSLEEISRVLIQYSNNPQQIEAVGEGVS